MSYNEETVELIRQMLFNKGIEFSEKKMFGGLCFMVDEKMCCAVLTDKKYDREGIMCRIGEDAFEHVIERPDCNAMDFTGKPMKGYVFVSEEGISNLNNLEFWIQLCLDFNPIAKKSKNKINVRKTDSRK